jgi:hypothetical protein
MGARALPFARPGITGRRWSLLCREHLEKKVTSGAELVSTLIRPRQEKRAEVFPADLVNMTGKLITAAA